MWHSFNDFKHLEPNLHAQIYFYSQVHVDVQLARNLKNN